MPLRRSAFTMLELLIVLAVVAIIATIVFVAVNPGQRLADARNARRQEDIRAIAEAVNLYAVNNGAYPAGLDDSLKMLGTATTGCEAVCGQEVASYELPEAFLAWTDKWIKGARADLPSGWVSPVGHSDPGNQWSTENRIYDNNTSTYSSNTYGGSGWGQFIILNMGEDVLSDRLQLKADYTDAHIIEVDIDVYRDGAWLDVFQGGNEAEWNCLLKEVTYTKGNVSQVRFRYNYRVGGYNYWLYELQVYRSAAVVNPPTCTAQEASAVQKTAAVLRGLVANDGGEPVEYRFNYGPTVAYGQSTTWGGSAKTGDGLSEAISGLTAGTTYHFQTQLRNSAGTVNCTDKQFTTTVVDAGWVLPTGFSDPSNTWSNEARAMDDLTATAATSYHAINTPVWSQFLYFTHEAIAANGVKLFAGAGAEVATVDVDVYKNNAWVDVYQGAPVNLAWQEINFDQGLVSQVRLRFAAANTNNGFAWELFELAIKKSTATSEGTCLDLSSALVPRYLPALPVDPSQAPGDKSYYAVRRKTAKNISVVTCQAELGKIFEVTK